MARKYWQISLVCLLALSCHAQGCDTQSTLNENDKKIAREYVVFNYRSIANDILNGSGSYVDALFLSLKLCPAQHQPAMVLLRKYLNEKRHPASFAIAVTSDLNSGSL